MGFDRPEPHAGDRVEMRVWASWLSLCALFVLGCAGCGTHSSLDRSGLVTGQALDVAKGFALVDFGRRDGVYKGSRLMAIRVAEEEMHEATGRLMRVRLERVGLLEVAESFGFRSIAEILDGSSELESGVYIRLAPPGDLPESWWEPASVWWISFRAPER